jgi:hypothetical protein
MQPDATSHRPRTGLITPTNRQQTIKTSDPANRQDIQRFLAGQARDDKIAARLADAGIESHEFVSLLAERCAGVWVYLRYVLSQIRTGPWDAADLSRLPIGLDAYYRQQVTGRRSDPAFYSEDLVVLATLGASQQPMTLDQLSRITRLDGRVVRTLANYQYRPFLTVDEPHPGRPDTPSITKASASSCAESPARPGTHSISATCAKRPRTLTTA